MVGRHLNWHAWGVDSRSTRTSFHHAAHFTTPGCRLLSNQALPAIYKRTPCLPYRWYLIPRYRRETAVYLCHFQVSADRPHWYKTLVSDFKKAVMNDGHRECGRTGDGLAGMAMS
jgi:hypothetical protein